MYDFPSSRHLIFFFKHCLFLTLKTTDDEFLLLSIVRHKHQLIMHDKLSKLGSLNKRMRTYDPASSYRRWELESSTTLYAFLHSLSLYCFMHQHYFRFCRTFYLASTCAESLSCRACGCRCGGTMQSQYGLNTGEKNDWKKALACHVSFSFTSNE